MRTVFLNKLKSVVFTLFLFYFFLFIGLRSRFLILQKYKKFRVRGVRNLGERCYSGHPREKDLLQKFEKFRVRGVIAVIPAQNF